MYQVIGTLWRHPILKRQVVDIGGALSCREKQMMNVQFHTKYHNVLFISTEYNEIDQCICFQFVFQFPYHTLFNNVQRTSPDSMSLTPDF